MVFEGVETLAPERLVLRDPVGDGSQFCGAHIVESAPAFRARVDKSRETQDLHVLRNRRLSDAQLVGKEPDSALFSQHQIEHFASVRVCNRPKWILVQ